MSKVMLPIRQKLEKFYNDNFEKLSLVVAGKAHVDKDLIDFYIDVYNKNKWDDDDLLCYTLVDTLERYNDKINRSITRIGEKLNRIKTAEYKLKQSKPFLQELNKTITDESDLSYELAQYYPVGKKTVIHELAEPNKKAKLTSGRSLLNPEKGNDHFININYKKEAKKLDLIPSSARNFNRYFKLGIQNHPYYSHFKPSFKETNLYNKKQGKKLYGVPGTWMFDIIYFSNHGKKNKKESESLSKSLTVDRLSYNQSIYLVGININTRYAVARRIEGKKVKDLKKAFKDLLDNEFKVVSKKPEKIVTKMIRYIDKYGDEYDKEADRVTKKDLIGATNIEYYDDIEYDEHEDDNKLYLKVIIFDGESAIRSKEFQEFCSERNIKIRTTHSGIHTQTAPIDRLCRTLRDIFTKAFMLKSQGFETKFSQNINDLLTELESNPIKSREIKNKLYTEAIYARQLFNGETEHTAPIPLQYWRCLNHDYYKKDDLKTEEQKNYELYYDEYLCDELYDVVDYYNTKQHKGLTKLLKEASEHFRVPLEIKDEEITPENIHKKPGLELLIIKYCEWYNKEIDKIETKFEIGDKVNVCDCFTTEKGSLERNNAVNLLGDWEVVDKKGETYAVYNNINHRLLHVSKYMLSPKVTKS